jgi:dTDP-4-amino-4,6-dideoxygalactose transaminase
MTALVPFCDLSRANEPIRRDLERAISRCMDRSWYLRGPEARAFEEEWADYCGQRYAVCCGSGTDALSLAARALSLRTAVIPASTLPLTAIGLHRGGAVVELVDVDEDGWVSSGCGNTVPVLMYGRLPPQGGDNAALYDAAHAHGWKPAAGTAAWSFYPTKSLGALGDAGAVTTNDADLAREMEMLCGRDDRLRRPDQFPSRADEIQAAVLRVKLKWLDGWLEQRREIARTYALGLSGMPLDRPGASLHHIYAVRVDRRDDLRIFLARHGIETKVHWPESLDALHGPWTCPQPVMAARRWCERTLSLPCYPGLTQTEITMICDLIGEWFSRQTIPEECSRGPIEPPPRGGAKPCWRW